MAVPKISGLRSGQQTFPHDGANWGPLACSQHEERGFVKSCGGCTETARLAIEHANAVEQDKARL